MFSHFTLKEANAMLPTVIKKFKNIVDMKKELARIQAEIESDPRYMTSFKEYVIKKQELNSALTNFYKSIEELEGIGIMVKSIDQGLLDFPSLRFNEEIWLCMKESTCLTITGTIKDKLTHKQEGPSSAEVVGYYLRGY